MTSTEDKVNIQNMESNIVTEDIYARKYKKHETDEERMLAKKISMQNYYNRNKERLREKSRRYNIDKKIKEKLNNEKNK